MTRPQSGLTLILGGARSGKTAFAERLAGRHSGRIVYLATAEARDDEMQARIAAHRASRASHWQTIEAPIDVVAAVSSIRSPDAVLLDCLTLWTSNLLLSTLAPDNVTPATADEAEARVRVAIDSLLAWQARSSVALYIVSNEVGMGITPPYPLGRAFQDILGRLNQRVAQAAEEAYFVVAGLALPFRALGAVTIDAPPPLPLD